MIKKLFNIFIKKEKPKIYWWSTIEGVEKVTPILPAKEFVPDWWDRAEHGIHPDPLTSKGTVKNCPSFPEYINQGFVVPLWTDLHLTIDDKEFEWKTPDSKFSFSHHTNIQFKDWLPRHVQDNISVVLLANCPWRLKTPPGWSVWQLPMFYHYSPLFEVLPGIIWSDIHYEINQQMVFKQHGEFLIKRGTPLAMYVPYERNKYTHEVQGPTLENSKWANESWVNANSKFRGGYKLHQAEVKKCLAK